MDDRERLISLKVEGALDRCSSLLREIKKLRTRYYPSAGAYLLLAFVEQCTSHIQTYLREEGKREDLKLLETNELEIRMQRLCQLVPFMHDILGLLQGSDGDSTPTEIIPPLRRLIQALLPGSEVLVASTTQLNYSITEVAHSLKDRFQSTPLAKYASTLPPYFFVITIPQVESDQVLMHGMLSHETGHGLYIRHKIGDELLKHITIDQGKLDAIVSELKLQTQLSDIELRNHVTSAVIPTITNWARELSSDAFGIHIFGPALLYATIFYTSSFTFLDSSSKTHPPARLRIRLMLKALLGAFDLAEFSGSIREFIESWSRISDADVSPQATEFQLAVASFTPEVLELIVSLTKAAITSPYTKEQYKADISDLGEAIVNILPAVERLGTDGGLEPTSFVSILNAGWYVQLAKLKEFENNRFQAGETPTTEAVRRGLHAIIRKSFELSEIKRRWKEISHVT
jgi:hypothetical protein